MKNKVKQPVEVGSKRWYRHMRIVHMSLWILPVLPLLYALRRTDWSGSLTAVAVMVAPWFLSAAVLAMLAHALWRIEVNVTDNSARPFTEKDSKVFRRTISLTVGLAVFLMLSSITLEGWGLTTEQTDTAYQSTITNVFVMLTVTSIAATLDRIHHKAMHTHEDLTKAQAELEKGV